MSEPVTIDVNGGAAVVTLNRPASRNVLSAEMVAALGDAMDEVEADPTARCVVVTGAGSAFCAGAELESLESAANGDFTAVRTVYRGFLRVRDSPLPTIAAVNGPAVGAGLNVALACDVRLAGESAVFDSRFPALRIHPGGGHLWMLTQSVGPQRAMQAALFGEIWDSATAVQIGLALARHPDAELLDAARDLAQRLDDQEADYVRAVTETARLARTATTFADAFDHEARKQEWSTGRLAFRTGIERIRTRLRG